MSNTFRTITTNNQVKVREHKIQIPGYGDDVVLRAASSPALQNPEARASVMLAEYMASRWIIPDSGSMGGRLVPGDEQLRAGNAAVTALKEELLRNGYAVHVDECHVGLDDLISHGCAALLGVKAPQNKLKNDGTPNDDFFNQLISVIGEFAARHQKHHAQRVSKSSSRTGERETGV
jgi:hypothetical protein